MISFKNAYLKSVSVADLRKITDLFYKQGFVVVDGDSIEHGDKLESLALSLNLGQPFVSNYNRTYFPNKNKDNNKSEIGQKEENKDKFEHPVFEETGALGQHVDGTFSPLGEVKTTLLLCKKKAISGGDTTLFNAYGAVKKIESESSVLAEAFRDKRALKRRSTFKGISEEMVDCALGLDPVYNREIIRLAFDSSADWEAGFGLVPNLELAYNRLVDIMVLDNEYSLLFSLNEGDIIVMDNTRITHGRTKYVHDAKSPRMMIRSVHNKLPSRM